MLHHIIIEAAKEALDALPAKRATHFVLSRPLSEEEREAVKIQRARVLLGAWVYQRFLDILADRQAEAEARGEKDVAAHIVGFLSGCSDIDPDRPQDALHRLEAFAAAQDKSASI